MKNTTETKINKMMNRRRKNALWMKAVALMAGTVAFGTFSVMTLPSFSMNQNRMVLACEMAAHNSAVIHTHDTNCFDANGELICELPELHTHVHGDECFNEQGDLICTEPEIIRHEHTKECYTANNELICGLDGMYIMLDNGTVIPEHQHNDGCFTVDGEPEELELNDIEMNEPAEPEYNEMTEQTEQAAPEYNEMTEETETAETAEETEQDEPAELNELTEIADEEVPLAEFDEIAAPEQAEETEQTEEPEVFFTQQAEEETEQTTEEAAEETEEETEETEEAAEETEEKTEETEEKTEETEEAAEETEEETKEETEEAAEEEAEEDKIEETEETAENVLKYEDALVRITVELNEEAQLPKDTTLEAIPMEDEDGKVRYAIHLKYCGEIVEPKAAVTVTMTFLQENFTNAETIDVLHTVETEVTAVPVDEVIRNEEGQVVITFRTMNF